MATLKQMPQALIIPLSVHDAKYFLRIRKDTRVRFSIPEITLSQLKFVQEVILPAKTCPERGPMAGNW
jgi:hypothetical protein